MQVICDGLELCDAALKVSKAVGIKTTNPVLEGIRMVAEEQTLTLCATDLEIGIECKIRADVLKEGEAIIPGKLFSELVRKMTNEKIELCQEDGKMMIKYCDSEGFISCIGSNEYPALINLDEGNYFEMSQRDLKEVISKAIFAVASDESRPILKGCLFEIYQGELKCVALDGFRLAIAKKAVKSSSNFKIVLPSRCLSEIAKNLSDSDDVIGCVVGENYMVTNIDGCKIITRLMQGDYINYRQILPNEHQTEIVVCKAQFEAALERAILLSKTNQNNLVKLFVNENILTISSNSEVGNINEKVNISKNGPDITIAFNAQYFLECLKVCSDEFVKILFNKPIHPCQIIPTDGDKFFYLILPVRMI